ncbi:hypothetical protein PHYSODRAFT_488481 [Phytophthora sojae]|uniref:RRM domain-containing protein n=1 Tax=Phytophthora sojae (strain P6497) TaxID=1094619 RepID=G4ZA34_PHYSP|nr:hypothetical protein PHYSODRAFT_488481 [Phytophthora sojae]EGZ21173.1 hypothetical protein PHYSODRAFT_488481 [Phytophthora sojae]|eukprot:XP_009523890.1 hypothetical protein PHYSODRAFT_488481 [Phytophthora sojae]
MGRREEEPEAGRRHGRHRGSPSPARGESEEEAIRKQLRESGWKKRRADSVSTADGEASRDKDKPKDRADKGSPRPADERRSSRSSRSTRRSRSPRRRDRERRSSRRKSSGSRRRSYSRSRSPASRSRSRSRSSGRRRRRHASSSRKRRSSRSPSRSRDARESKRSRRSTKSSRRSRSCSGSPRSPSRSSRRRRHRRNSSYSRSRSPSRSRRARRGGSRSRSRSPRDRRSPADPSSGVNPTITQLMAQYPTMSLQDIIAKMQASNVTMAAAVAQKPARELYVGNLPPNVTGPQLQEFLSTIIQQVGLTTQPGNPIINTWISTDGHFAFCEMRSVEECNLALLLNQLSLLGQPLKFGRPRSFMGPPQPMPQISARTQTALTNLGCTPNPAWFAQPAVPSLDEAAAAPVGDSSTLAGATAAAVAAAQPAVPAVASTTVDASLSAHRLIMSNIPVVLTEDQVKELVEPFGALKSFTLVKDTATGASMGSALFEYEDDSVTAQAVEGLNGLSIGGILLSVQCQPASGAALPAAPGATPNFEDQPSAVLKMANMVSIDELRDDDEYADLAEDVEEECKRFGNVTGLEIPRPKDGEEVPGLGCIYVRFEEEKNAVDALKALNGRKFGGNIVKVTYFPLDKFDKQEFS